MKKGIVAMVLLAAWRLAAAMPPNAGAGLAEGLPLDDLDPAWRDSLFPTPLAVKGAAAHPLYSLPLAARPGLPLERADTGYVDLNPIYGQIQDYECGDRTYDLPGYNHQGIDYGLWPYSWYQMDREAVRVIAAAPGTIVFKEDGHYDRQCSFNNEVPNFVGVEHADGSIALYFHLKQASLTAKPIGATVARGEYLGLVGSSGSSVLPHLHLETYYPGGGGADVIVEPHAGPCNPGDSWWLKQEPYLRPAIVRAATHEVAPTVDNVFPACAIDQDPHYRDFFAPNQPFYFAVYFRDAADGDQVDVAIFNPDDSERLTLSLTIDADLRIGWWSWGPFQFAQAGHYRAVTTFRGVAREHRFFVGPTIFASGFE